MQKVISKTTFSNEIVTAQNGEEALQYLNSIKPKDNDSNSKKQPQLIFLDLNMPVMGLGIFRLF
jgi:CheY-like chemotaxis protein